MFNCCWKKMKKIFKKIYKKQPFQKKISFLLKFVHILHMIIITHTNNMITV